MRKKGRDNAKWDDTSWTERANWDEFVKFIPLAITFGKGTTPVKKTVYTSLWHQHAMEEILAKAKHVFRTETDLTRSMLNTVIVMYYTIFIKRQGLEDSKVSFFYNKIREMEEEWIKTDMVDAIRHVSNINRLKRRKKLMSPEKENSLYKELVDAIPDEYKEEISTILAEDNIGNVYEIGTNYTDQNAIEYKE